MYPGARDTRDSAYLIRKRRVDISTPSNSVVFPHLIYQTYTTTTPHYQDTIITP